jgi:hypothetical protein
MCGFPSQWLEVAAGGGKTISTTATTNTVVLSSRMSIIGRPLIQEDKRLDLAAIEYIAIGLTRLVK